MTAQTKQVVAAISDECNERAFDKRRTRKTTHHPALG
jgi:hypothetical protein